MSKIRFFVPEDFKDGKDIFITDKSLVHKAKNVLRLKPGDKVYIFNGNGGECLAALSEISKKSILFKDIKCLPVKPMPDSHLTLAFPVTMETKIDFILQKATELGIMRFVPFISQRSRRIKDPGAKKARWDKIIMEASRQSGRRWCPEIDSCVAFDDVLLRPEQQKIVAAIDGRYPGDIKFNQTNSLFIFGPEGDFTDDEYEKLHANGFIFMKLSENILRVETAAFLGAGVIMLNI
ncbi:MAG: RsmE family RNA methyltransferase [Candidatus Omnitrophota bacterium]|nr:RsmE family RNA methyltransferase [Candidatus Omnitrophota bacterium]